MAKVISLDGGRQEHGLAAAEFFAGIGLARLGLEAAGFRVVWSNDVNRDKRDMYVGQFGESSECEFVLGDVADITAETIPGPLALAWASFPCIDLSLAGWRRGLVGKHSAAFWHFARVLKDMGPHRPPLVCLENVTGFATSNAGADLATAIRELNLLGYSADVLTIDARRFVPQSRSRLFVVGSRALPTETSTVVSELRPEWLQPVFADPTLMTHCAALPDPPALLNEGLADVVERLTPADARWWSKDRTDEFLSSLSALQNERLTGLAGSRSYSYRTAYRRTRQGRAVWEIRPDDIAGCLRTARGGSSKQALVRAGRGEVRVRWMTPREYARLMGADEYHLDGLRRNQALFGFGDAVCVPVVTWLAEHYLQPLICSQLESAPGLGVVAASA